MASLFQYKLILISRHSFSIMHIFQQIYCSSKNIYIFKYQKGKAMEKEKVGKIEMERFHLLMHSHSHSRQDSISLNSILIFHMDSKGLGTRAVICCLPRCISRKLDQNQHNQDENWQSDRILRSQAIIQSTEHTVPPQTFSRPQILDYITLALWSKRMISLHNIELMGEIDLGHLPVVLQIHQYLGGHSRKELQCSTRVLDSGNIL